MLELAENLSTICGIIAGFALFIYAFAALGALWGRIRHGEPFWPNINPIRLLEDFQKDNKLFGTLLIIALIVGIPYLTLDKFCSTTELGAFFEQHGEFEESYEAYISLHNKPIFCIANISKQVFADDAGRSTTYYIDSIDFPYGQSAYDLGEYDAPKGSSWIYINEIKCDIIIGKIADAHSYDDLKNEVLSTSGKCCASIKSDKFHYNWCSSAENISKENLVYFDNEDEAIMLGFEPCSRCFDY